MMIEESSIAKTNTNRRCFRRSRDRISSSSFFGRVFLENERTPRLTPPFNRTLSLSCQICCCSAIIFPQFISLLHDQYYLHVATSHDLRGDSLATAGTHCLQEAPWPGQLLLHSSRRREHDVVSLPSVVCRHVQQPLYPRPG